MKLSFFVRTPVADRKKKIDFSVTETLYVRLVDKGVIDQKAKSNIVVVTGTWSNSKGGIEPRIVCDPDYKVDVARKTSLLECYITERFNEAPRPIPAKWLGATIASFNQREMEMDEGYKSISDLFERFISIHVVSADAGQRKLSEARQKQYRVVMRTLQRYELYQQAAKKKYRLDVRTIGKKELEDIYNYIAREDLIFTEHPEIFEQIPNKKSNPKPRSRNTMADIFKKLRCFFNWCLEERIIERSPFSEFKIETEKYGSIYYLTWAEVKQIAAMDMSTNKEYELARDLMVLQAGVGCRVSDLMRLKKQNVYGGFVHYIPQKTMDENPETVSVPLFDFVKEIIKKYKDAPGDQLIPPMNHQDYNEQMRHVLTLAKITRPVTYLDPQTRMEVTAPINTVFSSHDLRRTFTNAIFQHTKGNTALTASYTGHKTDRAFQRYREVSDKLKKETIKGLNF